MAYIVAREVAEADMTKLEKSIRGAYRDIAAYLAGDASRVRFRKLSVPDDIDVKAVRDKMGLSQKQFAELFGFKLQTVQSWERKTNRRKPALTARLLLTALRNKPEAILDALVERRA
jgi:putative transcriptional regulator